MRTIYQKVNHPKVGVPPEYAYGSPPLRGSAQRQVDKLAKAFVCEIVYEHTERHITCPPINIPNVCICCRSCSVGRSSGLRSVGNLATKPTANA